MIYCSSPKTVTRHISNARFHSFKIISPNLVAVYLQEKEVVLKQPNQIGFCILEQSKRIMYQRYYRDILPCLPDCETTVCLTDTDSLLLKIVSHNNLQHHLQALHSIIDFSNYPEDHPLFSRDKENMLAFIKDEMAGDTLVEQVGLRSKCYALRILDKKSKVSLKSKMKGVKNAFKKKFTFGHFTSCIKAIRSEQVTQYNIRTKNHVVTTEKCTKVAMNSFDSKRHLHSECKPRIHSSAYGSVYIEWAKLNNKCPYC